MQQMLNVLNYVLYVFSTAAVFDTAYTLAMF